jgi:signal transduction histidine kinase
LSDILVGRNDSLPVDKRLRFAGAIRESGQRLLRLIDDLLDISKLEAGKMGFDFRHADIAATIDNAIEDVAPLAAAKNVAIVRAGQPPHTACLHDPARMRQVMINLLANAIKFSAPQSVITILLSVTEPGPGGASLMIEVADQGAGIPESELESVFDSFVQSSRTKNGAGGTGLGLSISRQIVEAHRGSIWAANNRAGGASLHVRIPLAFASSRNASQ